MAHEPKTRETDQSVEAFLSAVEPAQKQTDSREVARMMGEASGEPSKMWGPSIIGFGSYHYKYASGHEGDSMLIGFSPRKQAITLYIMSGYANWDELTSRLGKYKTGKACLYIKRLTDVDLAVLEELISRSVAHMKATNPV